MLLSILALVLFVLVARRSGAGAGRIDFSSLAVTGGVAVFLGAVALALLRARLSQAVERALTWAVVALLLALGYAYRSDLHAAAKRGMAEFRGHASARAPVVELERGAGGNFPVTAQINGARI